MLHRSSIRTLLLLALVASAARAEIVDRIVAVAGSRVVTWSDVLAEARYQAFLAGREPPPPDELARPESSEPILSRLIDQRLLEQDRDALLFDPPDRSETERRLAEAQQRFSTPEAYQQALVLAHLTDADLLERLEHETNLLAFVDRRLRPLVRLDSAETERYYRETLAPELRRKGQTEMPPLAAVREEIEEVLAAQQMNERLEQLLRDLRARLGVKVLPQTAGAQ